MFKYLFAALVGFVSIASLAQADEIDYRDDFFYAGGYFHNEGGNWTETIGDSSAYSFTEVARTHDYVEIFDGSRNMSVRMFDLSFWLKPAGQETFTFYKDGRWDNRNMITFGDPVNTTIYMGIGNIWKVITVDSQGMTNETLWRELYRDSSQIMIRNEGFDVNLTIMYTSVYRQAGHDGSVLIREQGEWSKPIQW